MLKEDSASDVDATVVSDDSERDCPFGRAGSQFSKLMYLYMDPNINHRHSLNPNKYPIQISTPELKNKETIIYTIPVATYVSSDTASGHVTLFEATTSSHAAWST